PPMKLPELDDEPERLLTADAVRLFLERARAVRPRFAFTKKNANYIVDICRRLDGVPLAIELAAAWLQILTLDEISAELEQGFDILSTEARDAPQRHRSLRAVFEHSWNLLEAADRETLMALSIFRGGFTRQAAQQVTGASLQQLMDLVSKSFLHHNPQSGRLEFHELLRQYAQGELRETPQANSSAKEAHAAYFADFMEDGWRQLKGERQLAALAEIEADLENVRAAWKYYQNPFNSPQTWKFMYSLWFVHWVRGWYLVGGELFAEAANALNGKQDEGDIALRALAMALQGYFLAWLDLSEQGFKLAEDAVETLQQLNYPEAFLLALDSLIVNAYFHSRWEQFKYTQLMYAIARQVNDKWLVAFALFAVSMAELVKGDYSEARRQAEIHLKLCEEIGDKVHATVSLIVQGHSALAQGDYEQAWSFYLRCLKISQQTGFLYSLQTATKYLGKAAISMGKFDTAEEYLLQCLVMTKEIGFVRDMINLYSEFARLLTARDKPEQAVELLVFVIQHPASTQTRMLEGRIRDSAQELLDSLAGEISPEDFADAVQHGQALEIDQIY
ncbi:MAG: tetratricopeptide repeat protein, partial [Anaerolineales bacterium]|nr:tetratricopeptide repeat protein [Anaerolineales bacterium]